MQSEQLAIANIPIQTWKETYDIAKALKVGTIFPELDMPFFAAEQLQDQEIGTKKETLLEKTAEQQEREQMLKQINEVSFALIDVTLYLDTQPEEIEAVNKRSTFLKERKELLKVFAERFYPLTQDCEGCWGKGPMPWEGACI